MSVFCLQNPKQNQASGHYTYFSCSRFTQQPTAIDETHSYIAITFVVAVAKTTINRAAHFHAGVIYTCVKGVQLPEINTCFNNGIHH